VYVLRCGRKRYSFISVIPIIDPIKWLAAPRRDRLKVQRSQLSIGKRAVGVYKWNKSVSFHRRGSVTLAYRSTSFGVDRARFKGGVEYAVDTQNRTALVAAFLTSAEPVFNRLPNGPGLLHMR
jgi:hypothetical protein